MPFDPQVSAFIDKVNAFAAPAGSDIQTIRDAYNHSRAQLSPQRPTGLTITEITLAGRPARRYRPADPHGEALFFHGGGYNLGNLDSHDTICAELAARAGCTLTAFDYRLAPEHQFPAAHDDALAAASALSQSGPVVLIGDSAGANLAAATAIALRGTARISGQVLIYPELGGQALALPSYTEKADAPLLSAADVKQLRADAGLSDTDPRATPLLEDDLTGVAPCIAFAAAEDPLRDDATAFADKLRAAGVTASAIIEPGLPHAYLVARHSTDRARDAFTAIVKALAGFAGDR